MGRHHGDGAEARSAVGGAQVGEPRVVCAGRPSSLPGALFCSAGLFPGGSCYRMTWESSRMLQAGHRH